MKLIPWITLLAAGLMLLGAALLRLNRTAETDAAFLFLPASPELKEWWLVLPDGSDSRPVLAYPARVDVLSIDEQRVTFGLHETITSNAYIAQTDYSGENLNILATLNNGTDSIYVYNQATNRVVYRAAYLNRRRQTEYAFFTFQPGTDEPHRHITTENPYAVPFYFGEEWVYFVAAERAPSADRLFRHQYAAPVRHSIFNFNVEDMRFLEFIDETYVYLVIGDHYVYRSDLYTGLTSPLPGFTTQMRVRLITPEYIYYTVQSDQVYVFNLTTLQHSFAREIDALDETTLWFYDPLLYGEDVLLLTEDRQRLLRMTPAGHHVEELLRTITAPIDDFMLSNNQVFYTVRDGVDLRLFRHDIDSGRSTLLTTMAGRNLIFDVFRGVYAGFIHLSYSPVWQAERRHLIIDTQSGQRRALAGIHGDAAHSDAARWSPPISLPYRERTVVGAAILLAALAGFGVMLSSVAWQDPL